MGFCGLEKDGKIWLQRLSVAAESQKWEERVYEPIPPCHQFLNFDLFLGVFQKLQCRGIERLRIGLLVGTTKHRRRRKCKSNLDNVR